MIKLDPKLKKFSKLAFKITAIAVITGICLVLALNIIVTVSAAQHFEDVDTCEKSVCVIVLGAGVRSDGTPTLMLKDRLDTAIMLYEDGKADKLLMSGDHHTMGYDEVNVMKQYAIDAGVPSEDIYMDHAGLSTYDTMNRAKNIFGLDKAIIVTQNYHLYRAVYLARSFGIDASGVPAINDNYALKYKVPNNIREMVARCKDFFYAMIKPDTTIMGEPIPITSDSNGDVTNDK